MPNTQSQQPKLSNRMFSHFKFLPLRLKEKSNVWPKSLKVSEFIDYCVEPVLSSPLDPIDLPKCLWPQRSRASDESTLDSGYCSLSSQPHPAKGTYGTVVVTGPSHTATTSNFDLEQQMPLAKHLVQAAPSLQELFESSADKRFVEPKKARSEGQNERRTIRREPVPQQVDQKASGYQQEGTLTDCQLECCSLSESPFVASRHSYTYHLSL